MASTTEVTLYLTKKGRRVLGVTFHDTTSWCHGITWICTLIPDEYSPYINIKFLQQLSALREKFATHGRLTRIQIDRRMFVFRHETEDKAIEMLGSYTLIEEIILNFLRETGAQVTDITMKSEVDEAAASIDQETLPRGTTDQDVLFSSKHGDDVDAPHSHPQQRHDDISHAQKDEDAALLSTGSGSHSSGYTSSDQSLEPLVKEQDSDQRASSDPSRHRRYPRLSIASHAIPSRADLDLYYASIVGNLEEVKWLLSWGVDVNSRGGGWSETPVMQAALRGYRDLVELLVSEGADVSLVNKYGNNTLHYVCEGGDVEMVEYVLSLNVVDINSRGWRSRTPVMEAALWGHREVVELLVSKGADVSLVDEDGYNILHYACMRGDVEMVKYVLSLNVVDINARDRRGKTAADVARSEGHQPVADLLVSRGAQ